MRLCQRCGTSFGGANRCPSCGYTAFVEVDDAGPVPLTATRAERPPKAAAPPKAARPAKAAREPKPAQTPPTRRAPQPEPRPAAVPDPPPAAEPAPAAESAADTATLAHRWALRLLIGGALIAGVPLLCNGLAWLIVKLVPPTAAGTGPLILTSLAVVLGVIGYWALIPGLLVGAMLLVASAALYAVADRAEGAAEDAE